MTLIGTPANILAAGILAERGLPTFGFFEFTPMGIVVLTTGHHLHGHNRPATAADPRGTREARRMSTDCGTMSRKYAFPPAAR